MQRTRPWRDNGAKIQRVPCNKPGYNPAWTFHSQLFFSFFSPRQLPALPYTAHHAIDHFYTSRIHIFYRLIKRHAAEADVFYNGDTSKGTLRTESFNCCAIPRRIKPRRERKWCHPLSIIISRSYVLSDFRVAGTFKICFGNKVFVNITMKYTERDCRW